MKSIRNIFASKTKKGNRRLQSKNINDYILPPHRDSDKRTIRILILGPGNSGKTTIVKQMKRIYQTLTDEDIKIMGPYIQDAVIMYIKVLCFYSKELYDKYEHSKQSEQGYMDLMTGYIRIQVSNELNVPNDIIQLCLIFYINDRCTKIEEKNESLRQEIMDLRPPYTLTEQLGDKIATLWDDVCIT